MKYRKKPVVIEAMQFTRDNIEEVKAFTEGNLRDIRVYITQGRLKADVYTLEGVYEATEGDYIIKGVKGEFYPCERDIFYEIYEKLDG